MRNFKKCALLCLISVCLWLCFSMNAFAVEIESRFTGEPAVTTIDNNESAEIILRANESTRSFHVTGNFGQSEARKMLKMVNDFRTGSDAWYWNENDTAKVYCTGLGTLTYDYALEAIAMQRAIETAIYWDHTRPNLTTCFTAHEGYNYWTKGENIAAGYGSAAYGTAQVVFEMWEEANKPYCGQGHRRNMLNRNFTSIGIGYVYYNGAHYWTMELGSPSSGNARTSAVDGAKTLNVNVAESVLSVSSISLIVENQTLEPGNQYQLPYANVQFKTTETWPDFNCTGKEVCRWSSSNTGVAVIENGYVVAKSPGTAKITGKPNGGTEQTFTLTVTGGGVKGDVNQDGVMDIKDARLAKRIALKAAKTNEYTEAGLNAGDLDGNGKITINEARKIKRAVLSEVSL